MIALIEYIPLQQGLRQINTKFLSPSATHWVYSITTRIKTSFLLNLWDFLIPHWVYSITTRIKTNDWPADSKLAALIEYIPLQQGLRHILHRQPLPYEQTHWVYSITTRIKTESVAGIRSVWCWLIEYIPLQQGLRLKTFSIPKFVLFLIEYIPLQQGLRHKCFHCIFIIIHTLIEYIPLQQGLRLSLKNC